MIVCVEQNGMQKSKPKSVIFYFADQKLTQKKMNKNEQKLPFWYFCHR